MKTLSNQAYKNRIRMLNYICAGLAVVLVVLQFIPFWGCYQCKTCGDGKIISINEYIWFANDHKTGLTSVLQKYYIPGFQVSDLVATSVLIQVASLFTLVMCIARPAKLTASAFALIAGLACVVGYLTHPVYQMGQLWQLHLAFGVLTLLAALAAYLFVFCHAYQNAKAELAAKTA